MSEVREVVAIDRPIGIPAGERIMIEVAREYGITVRDIRTSWGAPRRRLVPARVESARRMRAIGYSYVLIAKIMRKKASMIGYYLSENAKRRALNVPGALVLGPATKRFHDAIGHEWTGTDAIAMEVGISGADWSNYVSKRCHHLFVIGLIEKYHARGRVYWRRVP